MKHRVLLVTAFCLPLVLCAQKNDTLRINKTENGGVSGLVYIRHGKNTAQYERLRDFRFSASDSLAYRHSLEYKPGEVPPAAIRRGQKLPAGLPRRWCRVYMYRGSIYAYLPAAPGLCKRTLLSDTTLTEFYTDGPYASVTDSIRNTGKNSWELSVFHSASEESKLRIHIIDKKRQIAVFEHISPDGNRFYRLMAAAERIHKLPLVIEEGTSVFRFDTPDFKHLLNNN